jgi:hypothetical protein
MIKHKPRSSTKRIYFLFPFQVLDLTLFFFFFHRVAASTFARPTAGSTGLATVLNAIFHVALSFDGATTNRA